MELLLDVVVADGTVVADAAGADVAVVASVFDAVVGRLVVWPVVAVVVVGLDAAVLVLADDEAPEADASEEEEDPLVLDGAAAVLSAGVAVEPSGSEFPAWAPA